MTTFPAHDHAARRERIRSRLTAFDLDALVVTHAADVRWLTGLVASNGQVLLTPDVDGDVLFTDNRYAEPARATGMGVVLDPWLGELGEHVSTGARVGFQAEHLTVRVHERLVEALDEVAGAEAVPTTRVVAEARRVKDDAELVRLERACALTSEGWDWLVGHVQPGMQEREVARDLVRHLEDLGADGPAFPPIVASGPNSAVPHHRPGTRSLEPGDLLKVDFGALFEGYHADCTRVLALGDPGERLRGVHDLVRRAQQAGVEAAVAGATAGDVDAAAVGWLQEQDDAPTLHGVGHGVGLEIHETPILSSEPTATLEPGFVITVEPGLYLAGIGGVRIEDTIAVTSDGPRRLTTCSHDLVVL